MGTGWPTDRPIVRLRSSDVNRGDLAATGSEIDRSIDPSSLSSFSPLPSRLPACWHGESLSAAREHHARSLAPRVFTKAIVRGEYGRLESNRFWGRYMYIGDGYGNYISDMYVYIYIYICGAWISNDRAKLELTKERKAIVIELFETDTLSPSSPVGKLYRPRLNIRATVY